MGTRSNPGAGVSLSQLSIKTRIETASTRSLLFVRHKSLSQLSIKTRIETPRPLPIRPNSNLFESAIH